MRKLSLGWFCSVAAVVAASSLALAQTPAGAPAWPATFAALGVPATVELDYGIGPGGVVIDARAVGSPHLVFTEEAIRYVAARNLSSLVGMRQRETLTFVPPSPAAGTWEAPPQLRQASIPVYPFLRLRLRTRGEAEVSFTVSRDGVPTGIAVTRASLPDFGSALAAAVRQWRFQPAVLAGQATEAPLLFGYVFDPAAISTEERDWARRLGMNEADQFLATEADLEGPVRLVQPKEAEVPDLPETRSTRGFALVRVIVNESGRPVVPHVVEASHPEFGFAAVAAVAEFRYTPPKRKDGSPAAVETRMRIDFNIATAEAAAPTGRAARQAERAARQAERAAQASARTATSATVVEAPPPPRAAPARNATPSNAPSELVPRVARPPEYPRDALLAGQEGWVLLRVSIGADGIVQSADVVESSSRVFESSAIRAVRRWEFYPRIVDGEAVPTTANYRMRFRIN